MHRRRCCGQTLSIAKRPDDALCETPAENIASRPNRGGWTLQCLPAPEASNKAHTTSRKDGLSCMQGQTRPSKLGPNVGSLLARVLAFAFCFWFRGLGIIHCTGPQALDRVRQCPQHRILSTGSATLGSSRNLDSMESWHATRQNHMRQIHADIVRG